MSCKKPKPPGDLQAMMDQCTTCPHLDDCDDDGTIIITQVWDELDSELAWVWASACLSSLTRASTPGRVPSPEEIPFGFIMVGWDTVKDQALGIGLL